MKLACCVWAITATERTVLDYMKTLGFDWIDIQPQMLKTDETRLHAQNLGLQVSCMGVSFALPEGINLDDADDSKRQKAIDIINASIDHAHELGATVAYVVPSFDSTATALERFAESLCIVADHAQTHNIKVGIEHFPGRALPTAHRTLEFIANSGHDNLYLLLDSGHLQMSKEDAPTVIRNAGSRLAYVHLDDNDGEGDLHWSLLDGVMTEASLQALFDALDATGYDGAISLELHPQLPDPIDALRRSMGVIKNL